MTCAVVWHGRWRELRHAVCAEAGQHRQGAAGCAPCSQTVQSLRQVAGTPWDQGSSPQHGNKGSGPTGRGLKSMGVRDLQPGLALALACWPAVMALLSALHACAEHSRSGYQSLRRQNSVTRWSRDTIREAVVRRYTCMSLCARLGGQALVVRAHLKQSCSVCTVTPFSNQNHGCCSSCSKEVPAISISVPHHTHSACVYFLCHGFLCDGFMCTGSACFTGLGCWAGLAWPGLRSPSCKCAAR